MSTSFGHLGRNRTGINGVAVRRIAILPLGVGIGGWNRTLICGVGSRRVTITLHPQKKPLVFLLGAFYNITCFTKSRQDKALPCGVHQQKYVVLILDMLIFLVLIMRILYTLYLVVSIPNFPNTDLSLNTFPILCNNDAYLLHHV